MNRTPSGLRAPLAVLAVVIVLGMMFGDDVDRIAICIGLAFALTMSGQEGVES